MKFKLQNGDGEAVVALDGRLDFTANEDFRELLTQAHELRPKRLVFDLGALAAIDSVGLGLLYIAQEDLGLVETRITLRNPQGYVARLLDLTEADKTFDIER